MFVVGSGRSALALHGMVGAVSGERSAYFVEMAERGAQRVVERLAMIADRYGAQPNPNDDVITFAEMMQEYETFGHVPPDENCGSPVCERARRMVAGALRTMAQQAAAPPQGST